MRRPSDLFRVRPLLFALAACAAAGSAHAATLVTYTSEEAFLAALDAAPAVADFEAFTAGTILTTQIPGVVFSSPNDETEGYLPIQVVASPYASSAPHALLGGEVPGDSRTLQTIVMDFNPPITAFAFWLGAYDPLATDAAIRLEFTDDSSETIPFGNDSEDEEVPVFFGAMADAGIDRVRITSGIESGGYEEYVIDDVAYLVLDDAPPVCTGTPIDLEGRLLIAGENTDPEGGDGGIVSVALAPGAVNLMLALDPDFEPGNTIAPFTVFQDDDGLDASGSVRATDGGGGACTLPVNFRALGPGPLTGETLCSGEGILFSVSHGDATDPGATACSAMLPQPDDPPYPPGYEPSHPEDPFPCRVLTIESPLAGDTEMVYRKDGAFEPRLRLLVSRYDGMAFPPFTDVTESVRPILTVVPDPTRVGGKAQWSPVKVACALQSEICNEDDDDGDGSIDEGLPVGGPAVDADGDGYPLCAAAGDTPDCNDQIAAIHPGAAETCNGLDDDCDGTVDDGEPDAGASCTVPGVLGACAEGATACVDGGVVCVQSVLPSAEVCDGADNDCNGEADEDYVFSGYLPPINPDGSSIFRSRRAIPVKFRLADCAGGAVSGAVAFLEVFVYASGIVGDEIEEVESLATSSTGSLFRSGPGSGQYIYNLDTLPLAAGADYLLRTTLDDGTTHEVVISLQ